MTTPCFYHPDLPATDTCTNCGNPICDLDSESVADNDCLQTLREPDTRPGGA